MRCSCYVKLEKYQMSSFLFQMRRSVPRRSQSRNPTLGRLNTVEQRTTPSPFCQPPAPKSALPTASRAFERGFGGCRRPVKRAPTHTKLVVILHARTQSLASVRGGLLQLSRSGPRRLMCEALHDHYFGLPLLQVLPTVESVLSNRSHTFPVSYLQPLSYHRDGA